MRERGGGNQTVTKRHSSTLTQSNGPLSDVIRDSQHIGGLEELLQRRLLLSAQAMVAECLDLGDDRDARGILFDKLAQVGMLRLRGLNHNVAVEEHYADSSPRPGRGRSCRICFCQATGSSIPEKARC